jgi:hypothetical protein
VDLLDAVAAVTDERSADRADSVPVITNQVVCQGSLAIGNKVDRCFLSANSARNGTSFGNSVHFCLADLDIELPTARTSQTWNHVGKISFDIFGHDS